MATFKMRSPCPHCESPYGRVETRGGQSCVYCSVCEKWVYNAPRTETGERQRSMSTIHAGIKPKTRARVMLRANSRCELCGIGAEMTYLHVGHLVSIKQGLLEGLDDAEINHQENLAALCESCNSGLGDESVPLRVMLRITALRLGIRRASA